MTALEYWKERFGEEPQTDNEKLAVAMMADYANFILKDSATKKTFDVRIMKRLDDEEFVLVDEKYRKSQRETVAEWEAFPSGSEIEACSLARWLDTQDLKPGKSKVIKVTFEIGCK